MSDQLKRCPLLYDWCSLTYTKLEIILFSFHCRVIRQQCLFAVAQSRYLPSITGCSQHFEICTLLKIEPRGEIKLSSLNEYLCFDTDNRRT